LQSFVEQRNGRDIMSRGSSKIKLVENSIEENIVSYADIVEKYQLKMFEGETNSSYIEELCKSGYLKRVKLSKKEFSKLIGTKFATMEAASFKYYFTGTKTVQKQATEENEKYGII